MPPSDLVPIRTSRSAKDFWSRARDENEDVSPDFRELRPSSRPLNNSTTPFGRQNKPTFPLLPSLNVNVEFVHSRVVERIILKDEIESLEEVKCDGEFVRKLIALNLKLKNENTSLDRQLEAAKTELGRAWKVNKALTNALMQKASK